MKDFQEPVIEVIRFQAEEVVNNSTLPPLLGNCVSTN